MRSLLKGLQRLKGVICSLGRKDWLEPLTKWFQKIETSLALGGGHRGICSNCTQPQPLRKWWIHQQSQMWTQGVRKMRDNCTKLSVLQSPVSYDVCLVAGTFVWVCQMTLAWMSFFMHISFEEKSCCVLFFCHSGVCTVALLSPNPTTPFQFCSSSHSPPTLSAS